MAALNLGFAIAVTVDGGQPAKEKDMKRMIRSDGSSYFDHSARRRKEEKNFIRKAYKAINDGFYRFEDSRIQMHGLCQGKDSKDYDCWKALEEAFTTISQMQNLCNVVDPDVDSDYDDDINFSTDIDQLLNFFYDLVPNVPMLICRKRGLTCIQQQSVATTASEKEIKLLTTVNTVHEKVLDDAITLCRSVFGIFCKLCSGDTLFKDAAKELAQLGVVK